LSGELPALQRNGSSIIIKNSLQIMLSVAIVGFGLSGRYLQAPFFTTNSNFRLKTIVTNNQNPALIFPTVAKATSLEAVLADADIDLVSIASPNDTHFAYAKQSLLAGKHVLVEKPFTANVAQAKELVALAKKKRKHLFVFQNRRFDSDFLTVKKVVEGNLLGELHNVEIHFNRYKPVLNVKKWKEVVTPANGILYDLGSHIIDQTIALFGVPEKVSGQTYTQREGASIDDAFDIRLDYGKLRVTLKSSLLVREDTPRYILHGAKGAFVKYGIDVQEDQLKGGMMPNMPNFGTEPTENWGILNTDISGLHIKGKIETEIGNWAVLFQNIYEVIKENKKPLIKIEDVVAQIGIMQQIREGR
jgi:scyllo-inositol 2-dehydrogenase (NADP+)